MAKCVLTIEADSIEEVYGEIRAASRPLLSNAPGGDSAPAKDEGLAHALANALAEGEKAKRPHRTKAGMEAQRAAVEPETETDEVGPGAGQPKGNGAGTELTITDVREAINRALARNGTAKAEDIKKLIRDAFDVKIPSEIPPERFAEAIATMDAF